MLELFVVLTKFLLEFTSSKFQRLESVFKGCKVAYQGFLGDPLHGLITTSFCLAWQSSPVCLLESNVPDHLPHGSLWMSSKHWRPGDYWGGCWFVFKFYPFLLRQQSQRTYEGQRTFRSLVLPFYLEMESLLFLLQDYVFQASWPASFQAIISPPTLLLQARVADTFTCLANSLAS